VLEGEIRERGNWFSDRERGGKKRGCHKQKKELQSGSGKDEVEGYNHLLNRGGGMLGEKKRIVGRKRGGGVCRGKGKQKPTLSYPRRKQGR